MTRQELQRQADEATSTMTHKALKDVLALVDSQRELYGSGYKSQVRYSIGGLWQTMTVKG